VRCPYCQHQETKILETRAATDASAIRRRRRCPNCGERFYTSEHLDTSPLVVAKRDGTREDFDRKRLIDSLNLGSESLTASRRDAVADAVVARLSGRGPLVTSIEVGEAILECLREVDVIAHTRFALFFKRPRSIPEFQHWLSENINDEGKEQLQQVLLVVKSDKTRETFDRRSLVNSVRLSCRGCESIDDHAIETLVTSVEAELQQNTRTRPPQEVSTDEIGHAILERLRALDPVAYLSYALAFKNLNSYGKLRAELAAMVEDDVTGSTP
jgi:transcriptional repressor NrdR